MIPLIDCSPIAEGAFEDISFEDYTKVARDIGNAMTGIGMCNLINHGVPMEKVFGCLYIRFVAHIYHLPDREGVRGVEKIL